MNGGGYAQPEARKMSAKADKTGTRLGEQIEQMTLEDPDQQQNQDNQGN